MIDTKRLRQKILDLAIRGKLVEQDPSDEPASALLERIRAEKLQMVADGRLKKKDVAKDSLIYRGDDNSHYEKVGDGEPVCIDDELPFNLPDGWEWARLNSIVASVADGDHQPPPQSSEGIPFLVISNVTSGVLNFSDIRYVSRDYYDSLGEYRKPAKSDVLYTVTGSYGIALVVPDDRQFCVQRHIGIIRPSKSISSGYLCRCLQSGWIRSCADVVATGIAQKTVGLTSIRCFLIPIPPLAEQRRIVDALDERLDLVEEIERSQAELESLLAKARSKVLDLAIRGKLVGQDPSDEPASALLERIRAEKLQMVADGRLKKKDVARDSVIYRGEDNSYYERLADAPNNPSQLDLPALPSSWSWSRISSLVTTFGGKTPSMSNSAFWEAGTMPWVTSKDMKSRELFDSKMHITDVAAETMAIAPADSVLLVTRSGILRRLLPVAINRMDTTINQDLKALIPVGEVIPDYIQLALLANDALIRNRYHKDGTTVDSIDFDRMLCMHIPVPPVKEQQRICAIASEYLDEFSVALDT